MDYTKLSVIELLKLLDSNKATSVDITTQFIQRIKEDSTKEKKINAFIYFNEEKAIANAKNADNLRKKGLKGKLLGIPIAIKDNINITDYPTTCASNILSSYVSPFCAHVIEALQKEGAVIIGKTNMDEFAMGSSTEYSIAGVTRNPVNLDYSPGGSSGGSAASVAANFSPLALGSETGGSVRQPASFCGIVGLKPTYGRVSRWGLVAFGSSLDQIGTFGNNVSDVALLLSVIAGHDKHDSTSVPIDVPNYLASIDQSVKGLRIGIPKEYFIEGTDKEIIESTYSVIKILEKQGCIVKDISLPHTKYCIPVYYICATAEASSNLARFDGIRYGRQVLKPSLEETYFESRSSGFGDEVKRRIILGTYVLSAGYVDKYYLKSLKVRTLIKQDFQKAFDEVDLIITPTSPNCAFKIGERTDDPLQMYLSDVFTVAVNLAGIPAISIPAGKNSLGLPIGVQLIGNVFSEGLLLNASRQVEKEIH